MEENFNVQEEFIKRYSDFKEKKEVEKELLDKVLEPDKFTYSDYLDLHKEYESASSACNDAGMYLANFLVLFADLIHISFD